VIPIDETHQPSLRSWVATANQPGCDFPIQNLPFGVFRHNQEAPRIGAAIGDQILDLAKCGFPEPCRGSRLNELMSLGPGVSQSLRRRISDLLSATTPARPELLVPMSQAAMQLPAEIGDYTDFYASIHHATNVGRMFRPDHPLLPNYKYVPIGYHGRASSIVTSCAGIRRPHGQIRDDAEPPQFTAARLLDYELEVGFLVGQGNQLGSPVPIDQAAGHLFGACLVNDWSARDVQSWEYQPLGPFLAKSFATTLSPWVVTMEALAPFRLPASKRPQGDPAPLPYLYSKEDQAHGGIGLTLEAYLCTAQMRSNGIDPARLSHATFAAMYWTPAQLLAHHASNGCNLRPGDLIASGTVSGPRDDERGCLLELTSRGAKPLSLAGGETRKFLQDGDEVILRGYCEREGFTRIGFGECRGRVLPAD
jgi:fumarylacetoacetase